MSKTCSCRVSKVHELPGEQLIISREALSYGARWNESDRDGRKFAKENETKTWKNGHVYNFKPSEMHNAIYTHKFTLHVSHMAIENEKRSGWKSDMKANPPVLRWFNVFFVFISRFFFFILSNYIFCMQPGTVRCARLDCYCCCCSCLFKSSHSCIRWSRECMLLSRMCC